MPVGHRASIRGALMALGMLAAAAADAEQLYSIDVANDRLMSLDSTTGAVTEIGPLGADALDIDLVFTADGTLWGLNSGSGTRVDLWQIDTATGAIVSSAQVFDGAIPVPLAEGLAARGNQLVIAYDQTGSSNSNTVANLSTTGTVSGGVATSVDVDGLGNGHANPFTLYGSDRDPGLETLVFGLDPGSGVTNPIASVSHTIGFHDLVTVPGEVIVIDTFAQQLHRLDIVTGAPIGAPVTLSPNLACNGLALDAGGASLVLSPDVTTDLSGTRVEDQDVASDDGAGSVVTLALGTLPIASDITAYARAANGDLLFSLDTTVDLDGVVARPGDVVRYDGTSYSIEFDAAAAGVPFTAQTDAVSVAAGGILLSFDTTVDLGEGIVAADEDLVVWDGAYFNWVFIGSSHGLDARLDVDAARELGGGRYLLSFDTAGEIAGFDFDDEDVLEFDPSGPGWSLHYDGSSAHPPLVAADVTAVPEPGALLQLLAGAGLLAALPRRRNGG